jgi:hypothetical protein
MKLPADHSMMVDRARSFLESDLMQKRTEK